MRIIHDMRCRGIVLNVQSICELYYCLYVKAFGLGR